MFTLNYDDSRYIPSSQINSSNAEDLQLAWFYSTGYGVTSTPIVHNGVFYFGDWDGHVYALNLLNGSQIWKISLPHAVTGTPTLADGMLYVATNRGSDLYALNYTDGQTIWNRTLVENPNQKDQYGIWASPISFKDIVYVGVAESVGNENCSCIKGQLDALNALTGTVLWRFNSSIGTSGGAGVWGSVVVDAKTNSIFFGTGNPYVDTNSTLYADSVICLNAMTGSLIWYNQVIVDPKDDFDFGSTPNLFTINISGHSVDVVGIGSKDGDLSRNSYYYIFDRNNGTLIAKISLGGGVIGLAGYLSPSPSNTELFIPSYQQHNATCCGALVAVYASNDTIAWKYNTGIEWGSATLIPGAVLVGDLYGYLYAISSSTGQLLNEIQVPYSIADGITVVNNFASFGNYPFTTVTNATSLGLYAYCVDC